MPNTVANETLDAMCCVCGAHCATWIGKDDKGDREYTLRAPAIWTRASVPRSTVAVVRNHVRDEAVRRPGSGRLSRTDPGPIPDGSRPFGTRLAQDVS